jgi:hypothetical protein
LTIGLNKKTARKYPIITIVDTRLSSSTKLLNCNATESRKKKLQINATREKNKSIDSFWFIVYC